MRTKAISKFVALTFLAILSISIIQQAACNVQPVPMTFRLLAVEGTWIGGSYRVQSEQHLIKSLLRFSNWNNITNPSYIHLLSRYTQEQCINEAKPYLVGNSTKFNLQSEITNFLGQAGSNECVILCITTDGGQSTLFLDKAITAGELTSWLQVVRGTVCVIIDACNSGSFISDGQGGPLGQGRIVLCSSLTNQSSWGRAREFSFSFRSLRSDFLSVSSSATSAAKQMNTAHPNNRNSALSICAGIFLLYLTWPRRARFEEENGRDGNCNLRVVFQEVLGH